MLYMQVGKYLNRLSDLLFTAGRQAARAEGRAEILWTKAAPEKVEGV